MERGAALKSLGAVAVEVVTAGFPIFGLLVEQVVGDLKDAAGGPIASTACTRPTCERRRRWRAPRAVCLVRPAPPPGFPYSPVASIATCVTPRSVSRSRGTSNSLVVVAKVWISCVTSPPVVPSSHTRAHRRLVHVQSATPLDQPLHSRLLAAPARAWALKLSI